MSHILLENNSLPTHLINEILNRDVVLWIASGFENDEKLSDTLAELATFPWQHVLCESFSAEFIKKVSEAENRNSSLKARRGFIHFVAKDPQGEAYPERALPFFLLNGRDDARDVSESESLRGRGAQRRRLNMQEYMLKAPPRRLLVVSPKKIDFFEDLQELWAEGYRSHLTIASPGSEQTSQFKDWLKDTASPTSIDYVLCDLSAALIELLKRLRESIPTERILIRTRDHQDKFRNFDITDIEYPEQPVLDRYTIIPSSALRTILPVDLSQDNFNSFFNKEKETWEAYAAGLPWDRTPTDKNLIIQALAKAHKKGADANTVFFIPSDSGAGATTQIHALAYHSALEGYPALIARQIKFQPDPVEITGFLTRAKRKIQDIQAKESGDTEDARLESRQDELPWLLVFDVQHWQGKEFELQSFVSELKRSRRPIVLLVACSTQIPNEFLNLSASQILDPLTHELKLEQALNLGKHLNGFLENHGQAKSQNQWERFWNTHRPDIEFAFASFWVALEFWLKGELELGESVQGWLYRQLREANLSVTAREVILEVSAMSIERIALPEGLMGLKDMDDLPLPVRLDELRTEVPALALVCAKYGYQRRWALAHDILGRYLLNAVAGDHELRTSVDLKECSDPTDLRLTLLSRIVTRSSIASAENLAIGLEFATRILKLDPESGGEFFRYWRRTLDILDSMPDSLTNTSRTFNHHVAISRRRVATNDTLFHLTIDEKRYQLKKAVEQLRFAYEQLERKLGDESDINILNSLALAYQNWAELEVSSGGEADVVEKLRHNAHAATKKALKLDPNNSYVLETAARNVLQDGALHPDSAAKQASEALTYVFQAMSLEHAGKRQIQLTKIANKALKLLHSSVDLSPVEKNLKPSTPEGLLIRTWLALTNNVEAIDSENMAVFPEQNIADAISLIENSPENRSWLVIRLYYDLIVQQSSKDLQKCVGILDELSGTNYHFPPQLMLDYAILLYQASRYREGMEKYQHLRSVLRGGEAFVTVPKRLSWLLSPDGETVRVCDAKVFESTGVGTRDWAVVPEIGKQRVPFRSEEFGMRQFSPGSSFKCRISFGPMGPFIRPAK